MFYSYEIYNLTKFVINGKEGIGLVYGKSQYKPS